MNNLSFKTFDNNVMGFIFAGTDHPLYPVRYYNVGGEYQLDSQDNCSYYGFVYQGSMTLDRVGVGKMYLTSGMYFSLSDDFSLCGEGKAVVIEVFDNEGVYKLIDVPAMNLVGGPIESKGRLKYIDGCSDSLLISPVKMGGPCLNHLHFPKAIEQTAHTHPSHRIGIVSKGSGKCVTPFGDLDLIEGMIFIILEWDLETYGEGLDGEMHPAGTHCFFTFDEAMDVIAFHPDSDFGPTDVNHPMINRTIVKGLSASSYDNILTKNISE